jgi:DNA-binding transcriptional ArsR family regulator
MEVPELSSSLEITDPALVRVFADSPKRRLLLSFVDRSRSVSEMARELQQPLARVHYHVTDLARLGLLKVERIEPRHGRPVKYYRAVSSRFLVPLDVLEEPPGEGLAVELRLRLREELLQSGNSAVLFHTENGRPRVCTVDGEGKSRNAAEFWQVVRFKDETIRAFAAELSELMSKYAAQSGEGHPYLLHGAFAPRKLS